MRTLASILCLLGFLAAPAAAQVTLDEWGTYATIVSSDCADFCDPDIDFSWLLGLTFEVTNSGAEANSTDATWSGARGDAFAEADVGTVLGPIVRVDASSAAGGWTDGTGTAVQGYTYIGVAPDTIDVNVALTGTIVNPDADPATGLAAQLSYVGDANLGSFEFDNAVIGLLTPDGAVALEQTTDGTVALADVLSIPVNPGDQFYLVASSAATAGGAGASAESLSTLTASFAPADAANLVAANGAGGAGGVPSLSWPLGLLLAVALVASASLIQRTVHARS